MVVTVSITRLNTRLLQPCFMVVTTLNYSLVTTLLHPCNRVVISVWVLPYRVGNLEVLGWEGSLLFGCEAVVFIFEGGGGGDSWYCESNRLISVSWPI